MPLNRMLACRLTLLQWYYKAFQILGLDIYADTLVGDEMRKGISGGQMKCLATGYCPVFFDLFEISLLVSNLLSLTNVHRRTANGCIKSAFHV